MAYVDKIVVEGTTYDLGALESLKDINGRNRFIEGTPTSQTVVSGLHYTYSKWSLSGSHLMLVVAGYTEPGTTIPSGQIVIGSFYLPQWVLDKIYPIVNPYVAYKTISFTTTGYSESKAGGAFIFKSTDHLVMEMFSWTPDANTNEMFRVQFDLIIDTD